MNELLSTRIQVTKERKKSNSVLVGMRKGLIGQLSNYDVATRRKLERLLSTDSLKRFKSLDGW